MYIQLYNYCIITVVHSRSKQDDNMDHLNSSSLGAQLKLKSTNQYNQRILIEEKSSALPVNYTSRLLSVPSDCKTAATQLPSCYYCSSSTSSCSSDDDDTEESDDNNGRSDNNDSGNGGSSKQNNYVSRSSEKSLKDAAYSQCRKALIEVYTS